MLTYPWERPVFCIGSATNLVRRLGDHAKFVHAAREHHTRW